MRNFEHNRFFHKIPGAPMRIARTLSVDRSNPQDLAKERCLEEKRELIRTMRTAGELTESHYIEIFRKIDDYVRCNARLTANDFSDGLNNIVNNYFTEHGINRTFGQHGG